MSTSMRINMTDLIGLPIFIAAVAVSLGVLDSTMAGVDLGATLVDFGSGHILSIANGVAIATLAYVAYTNDWSNSSLTGMQIWVVAATIGLVISPPLFPLLVDTIAETPAAFVALAIQAGGYITFSYLG